LRREVDGTGVAIVEGCLDAETLRALRGEFGEEQESWRNLLELASVRELAGSSQVRELAEAVLGPECFAVGGTFFNKTEGANWKVTWHQDVTIAVRKRRDLEGFRAWTMKECIVSVQPPAEVMDGMMAIRLHLDKSGVDNGPLRVIGGSHLHGRLSVREIQEISKESAVTCCVPEGGAVLMRPMVVHASSQCEMAKPRRVIHLEFVAQELPSGLEWRWRRRSSLGGSADAEAAVLNGARGTFDDNFDVVAEEG
jgi:ectoine hydroxylase-related dioxygenase (phytanoyl-CoA dioxygenase family)